MQAPAWATRLVGWRWMPSVALVSGSLAFVALAVAIVPEDLGAVASGADRAARSRLVENAATTGDEPSSMSDDGSGSVRRATRRAAGARTLTDSSPGNIVQSIFHSSPKVELPVEPVDPTPQEAPPPPPPPPAPTNTIFTLPSPPPPDTAAPPAAPEPPSEPQGITGQ